MRSLLDLIIDRLEAGIPVELVFIDPPCRYPDYSGTYAYTTLGCRCPRCMHSHTDQTNRNYHQRRNRELAACRARHPSARRG